MTPEPIHPGETLREDLDALGMSAAELARRIEVPVNRITQILNDQRAVTGDTALQLERFFGTSGEFWLKVKCHSVRAHENLAARQGRAAIAKRLPVQSIGGMGAAVEIVNAYGYARLLPVVAIGCF